MGGGSSPMGGYGPMANPGDPRMFTNAPSATDTGASPGYGAAGTAMSAVGNAIGGKGGKIASGVGSGAATGATVGSAVPGIGTAIGAGVGALVGGIGSLFGGGPEKPKPQIQAPGYSAMQAPSLISAPNVSAPVPGMGGTDYDKNLLAILSSYSGGGK